MESNNSQLSILNSQLIKVFYLAVLTLAMGCGFSHNNDEEQQVTQSSAAPDQVFASPADSLKYLINTAKTDTFLVDLYINLGHLYLDNTPDSAEIYLQKAGKLSEELNYAAGYCQYACYYAFILSREGKTDSLSVLFQNGLEMAREVNDIAWTSKMLANLGNTYLRICYYQTALEYFLQALPYFEKTNDRLYQIYDNMQILYRHLVDYNKSIEYGEKALSIIQDSSLNIHDEYAKAAILINLSISYLEVSPPQFEKALNVLQQSLSIAEENNYTFAKSIILINLGDYYRRNDEMKEAENYYRQALEIKEMMKDMEGIAISMSGLANCELSKKNYKKAEEYIRKALEIGNEFSLLEIQRSCMDLLSKLALINHDYKEYIYYESKSDSMSNIMRNHEINLATQEMQIKYETEKKELKITALEDERLLMRELSIAIGLVLFLSLATFFSLWRWTIQKKRVVEQQKQLAEQYIKQLEQEKQLVATQAVLDGETQERARLARDLHDGLGSMLTGVKLNLMEMKKGATLEYTNVERFDKALGLLDRSVNEMRRVAHHLMPDSLSRFGLKPAVSDFCSGLPSVRFAYYGDESRLDPKLEVMIFRSIHELVNNALKYAGADNIIVQLIQESNRIAFTVQDNGCGFDTSVVTQGMGLQNIRTRIASYNGIINIDSKIGEGTEVNVELKIES